MNRFALILTALFIGLVAATSCSRTDPTLARADAVMEQAPDSALAILEAVDTATLRSERSRALYGLLLTQARVKCDVPIESDSLIAASARYFADHGPDSLSMRASFYKGVVLRDLNNISDAITPATEAHEISVKLDNSYWRAKSAELLADIFNKSYAIEESIEWCKEASYYYDKSGRELNHLYSLCDLGVNLSNYNQNDKAIELLDSIYKVASTIPDSSLMAYCQSELFSTAIFMNDYHKALDSWNLLQQMKDFYTPNLREKAWASQMFNAIDSLYPQFQLKNDLSTNGQKSSDLITVYESYAEYYKSVGDYKKAVIYMDSAIVSIDSTVTSVFRNSAIKSQRDFYNQKFDSEQQHSSYLKTIILLVLLCFLLILVTAFIIYRYRMASKNAALEQRMVEILMMSKEIEAQENRNSALSSDLTAANSAVTEMSQQLEHMFRDNWNTINNICDQYIQTNDSRANMSMLVKAIDSELAKLRDGESMARIEHDIDLYMNGIVSRLRQECPSLKEDDVAFFCLICAGFTPRAVSLITGLKLKSFYTKKSRLIKRIEQSACPSAPDFLRALH